MLPHDPRHAYATAGHDGSCYGQPGNAPPYSDSSMGAPVSFPTPSSRARQPYCCAHDYNSYPTAQLHLPTTSPSMMQPVPMAPYSPDVAAGHGTPTSHGHVHMPACFSYNGAAARPGYGHVEAAGFRSAPTPRMVGQFLSSRAEKAREHSGAEARRPNPGAHELERVLDWLPLHPAWTSCPDGRS